jgi:general stress protein YciG
MANGLRGFALMDPEKQRVIARLGGKAAHLKGTAHEWSSEQARAAGRKGAAAKRRIKKPRPSFRKMNSR